MYTPLTAVALRTVRHNDKASILTGWSPELGRISIAMPAGNGAESRRRRALTMPMGLFEGVADIRPGKEILQMRDMKAWNPGGRCPDVASSPVRATVAMFIAEVLGVVTREGDPDPSLWQLMVDTSIYISEASGRGLANLPVAFMLRLAGVLGIEPDYSEALRGYGLDLPEGVFRMVRPLHDDWIDGSSARILTVMHRAGAGYAHIGLPRLSRTVRSQFLNLAVRYFVLHHYPLDKLRSLDVLTDTFA